MRAVEKPKVLTFDIFGTVLDWRGGLAGMVRALGYPFREEIDFDRVIHAQAADEQARYSRYRDIVARSLHSVLDIPLPGADLIGARAGGWPLFADSKVALARLQRAVPCIAMTNSDVAHGKQVQAQLGFELSGWVCAEDVGCYKPAKEFWHAVAKLKCLELDASWWHVAAYGDYDLTPAHELGLTTVFIGRPHSVPYPTSDFSFRDLAGLANFVVPETR